MTAWEPQQSFLFLLFEFLLKVVPHADSYLWAPTSEATYPKYPLTLTTPPNPRNLPIRCCKCWCSTWNPGMRTWLPSTNAGWGFIRWKDGQQNKLRPFLSWMKGKGRRTGEKGGGNGDRQEVGWRTGWSRWMSIPIDPSVMRVSRDPHYRSSLTRTPDTQWVSRRTNEYSPDTRHKCSQWGAWRRWDLYGQHTISDFVL
jgi:hypothetical protein